MNTINFILDCELFFNSLNSPTDTNLLKNNTVYVILLKNKNDVNIIDFTKIEGYQFFFCVLNNYLLSVSEPYSFNMINLIVNNYLYVVKEHSFINNFNKTKKFNYSSINNHNFKLIKFNNSISLIENYIVHIINNTFDTKESIINNSNNIDVNVEKNLFINLEENILPNLTIDDSIKSKLVFNYNKSNNIGNILKFIHITKNAGTFIEDKANQIGILWGRFDPVINNENLLDEYKSINTDIYHLNPFHFKDEVYNLNKSSQLKTFCVVRNPYERIVSEVFCKWIGISRMFSDTSQITREIFNKFIEYNLQNTDNLKFHYARQWEYIYKENKIENTENKENTENIEYEKITDHVIKYENFNQELGDLFNNYNINIKLSNNSQLINKSNKLYSVKDITSQNLALINKVYENDFKLLGYDMMNINTINKDELTLVMGYWEIKSNTKKEHKEYLNHLKDILPKLVDYYEIIFYYNDNNLFKFIKKIIKEDNLKINIRFIKSKIEELPTYSASNEAINNFKKSDIVDLKSKYNIREKGVVHYLRELEQSGENVYKKLFTVWTSKLFLIEQLLNENVINTKYVGWCDISITRCQDKFRRECIFDEMSLNLNKVNFISNTMQYYGKVLPVSAGIIIGNKNKMSELIKYYKLEFNEIINENYCHDEETILGRLYDKTDLIQIIC